MQFTTYPMLCSRKAQLERMSNHQEMIREGPETNRILQALLLLVTLLRFLGPFGEEGLTVLRHLGRIRFLCWGVL